MAGQMLLLNPAKRRKSRTPRSAAQKAATARMLAANRRKRTGASKRPAAARAYAANPVKRRKRRAVTATPRRATRRYKRNPIGLPKMNGLIAMLTDAAISGGGALAVDLAMGKVAPHLPASIGGKYDTDGSINYTYAAVKIAFAVAIGSFLPKALPGKFKKYAEKAALGSLTVQAYDIAKHMLPATMTLGYVQPATVADFPNGNMGAYLSDNSGMGAYLNGTGAGSADPIYAADGRVGEGTVY